MANSYFQFKQFTIHQQHCSLKVSTDSCILGAWAAQKLTGAKDILDIGSGSGLLTLMLAQKTKARIDAIELDEKSYLDSKLNVENTEWRDRCNMLLGDVRNYAFTQTYNNIICNPPFHERQLISSRENINLARHSRELSLMELFETASRLLTKVGNFFILLPFHRRADIQKLGHQYNMAVEEELHIRHSSMHPFNRLVVWLKKGSSAISRIEILDIHQENGSYSELFKEWMKDYYINL